MSSNPGLDAAEFTGSLWAAITDAGTLEPGASGCLHYSGVYDPAWLAGLPLRAAGQPVALAPAVVPTNNRGQFRCR